MGWLMDVDIWKDRMRANITAEGVRKNSLVDAVPSTKVLAQIKGGSPGWS